MDPTSLPPSPPSPFAQKPSHCLLPHEFPPLPSTSSIHHFPSGSSALQTSTRVSASRREALVVLSPLSLLSASLTNDANALEQLKFGAYTSRRNVEYLRTTNLCNIFAFMEGYSTHGSTGIGLLGFLIFGFLYLKEKWFTLSNQSSLQDVQLRIKVAEAELCSQMKRSVGRKSQNLRCANNIRSDPTCKEILLTSSEPQSDVQALRQDLLEHEELCQSLNSRATELRTSIEKTEEDCRNLETMIKNEENEIREREKGLQAMDCHLRFIEEEISLLRKSLENKQMTLDNKIREYHEMTGSFLEALEKNKDSEEKRLEELAEWDRQHNMLTEEVSILSAQSKVTSEEEDHAAALVGTLISQKEELDRIVQEKRGILDGLEKLLNSSKETVNSWYDEIKNIKLQLLEEEKERFALEASHENDPDIMQLMKTSSEVQREYDLAKGLTSTLRKELLAIKESLQASEVEASSLQEKIQYFLTAEKQLESELLKLSEENQSGTMSLRKVKRAASYAKKKLSECEGVLQEHYQLIETLHHQLEQVKQQVKDLREEKSSLVSKLKEVDTGVGYMEDKICTLAKFPVEAKEQSNHRNVCRSIEVGEVTCT